MNKESPLRILSFFVPSPVAARENCGRCCLAGISRQHGGPQGEEESKCAGSEETCNNFFPLVSNVRLGTPNCLFDGLAESDVMAVQVLGTKFSTPVGLIAKSIIDLRASADKFGMKSVHV